MRTMIRSKIVTMFLAVLVVTTGIFGANSMSNALTPEAQAYYSASCSGGWGAQVWHSHYSDWYREWYKHYSYHYWTEEGYSYYTKWEYWPSYGWYYKGWSWC